jgi:putrescine transport system substrate-binding protein
MLRPEIAARTSSAVAYANGNLELQVMIDKDVIDNPSVYPPPETFAWLYIVTSYSQDVLCIVTHVRTKFKTGR